MVEAVIQSSGDLEIVLLHESHEALASVVGKNLYTISGDAPKQEIRFQNEHCFDLFLVRIVELIVEGRAVVTIDGRNRNLGLLDDLSWLDQKVRAETENCGLRHALPELKNWLDTERDLEIWCPDIEMHVNFPITRRELI